LTEYFQVLLFIDVTALIAMDVRQGRDWLASRDQLVGFSLNDPAEEVLITGNALKELYLPNIAAGVYEVAYVSFDVQAGAGGTMSPIEGLLQELRHSVNADGTGGWNIPEDEAFDEKPVLVGAGLLPIGSTSTSGRRHLATAGSYLSPLGGEASAAMTTRRSALVQRRQLVTFEEAVELYGMWLRTLYTYVCPSDDSSFRKYKRTDVFEWFHTDIHDHCRGEIFFLLFNENSRIIRQASPVFKYCTSRVRRIQSPPS
jgi:hypothetical protein